jgi:hypothetical protein
MVCWLVCVMVQGNGIKHQLSFIFDSEILTSIYLLKKPLVTKEDMGVQVNTLSLFTPERKNLLRYLVLFLCA